MKSQSRLLSVAMLALAAGSIVSCSRTETVSQVPSQFAIEARQINASHTLNKCYKHELTRIDLSVNFASASDKLSPEAHAELQRVAAIINSPDFVGSHVLVEGYTDSVGKHKANVKLSHRRALAVVHALVTEYGVPASLLSAEGFGSANPVATNSTASGRAANRRATFSVSGSM